MVAVVGILGTMPAGAGPGNGTGWAAMRPVLVAFLVAVDAFAVATLALARPHGWLPPLIAFGSLLVGLAWFEGWAIRHRHDDE